MTPSELLYEMETELLKNLVSMSEEEAQKEADTIKAEKATIDAGSIFGMDAGATA